MSEVRPENRRVEGLDALRGIAALAVVLYHFTERYAQVNGVSPVGLRLSLGEYGVDLFFMISGFVILMTLARCRSSADFAVSRASRLFPAYWACMVLTLAAVGLMGTGGLARWEIRPLDVVWNLTMLQEFAKRPNVDGVYWTLAVELRFYFWAWLLWITGALARPLLVVTAWLALTASNAALPGLLRVNAILEWFPLFGVGVVAFSAAHGGKWTGRHILVLLLAVAVNAWNRPAIAAAIDAGLALVFIAGCHGRGRVPGLLLQLGAISYPLYLVHQNLGFLIIHALGAGAASFVAALATAFVLAWGVHRGIEQPAMLAIRGRWRQWRARVASS